MQVDAMMADFPTYRSVSGMGHIPSHSVAPPLPFSSPLSFPQPRLVGVRAEDPDPFSTTIMRSSGGTEVISPFGDSSFPSSQNEGYFGKDLHSAFEHSPSKQSFGKELHHAIKLTSLFSNPDQPHLDTEPFQAPLNVDKQPLYYERFSSFFTVRPLGVVLKTVLCALKKFEGVDFSYNPQRGCIKGVSYFNQSSASWVFKVYKAVNEGYLCEFQRRSGCSVGFRQLYLRLLDACSCLHQEKTQSHSEHSETYPSLDDVRATTDCTWLQSLTQLKATSEIECIRALACLARKPELQKAVLDQTKLLSWLSSGPLLSNDFELQRLSASIVASLCSNPGLHRQIADTLLDSLLQVVDQPSSLYRLDAQRSAKQCLASLSSIPSVRQCILDHQANSKNHAFETSSQLQLSF